MLMCLNSTVRTAEVKCKYINRKCIWWFIYNGDGNFGLPAIIYEIFSLKFNFDVDVYDKRRSNIIIPIERAFRTSYLMAIVMFAISDTTKEVFENKTFQYF